MNFDICNTDKSIKHRRLNMTQSVNTAISDLQCVDAAKFIIENWMHLWEGEAHRNFKIGKEAADRGLLTKKQSEMLAEANGRWVCRFGINKVIEDYPEDMRLVRAELTFEIDLGKGLVAQATAVIADREHHIQSDEQLSVSF
jgi:hypothetical protein